MLSRLRRFIWQELKRIYERYDLNHSDTLDAGEIEIICREVLKETNKSELDSILFNLLRLGSNGEVSFREFVSFLFNAGLVLPEIYRRSRFEQALEARFATT